MTQNSGPIYEFGPFVLDTPQHLLLREGQPVAIGPKTYDTLLFFLKHKGRMVTKQELMESLWPESYVEESNLTQQISTLRRALGESAGEPKYIVTISGRGYRFATEVKEVTKPVPSTNAVPIDEESVGTIDDAGHKDLLIDSGPVEIPEDGAERTEWKRWLVVSFLAVVVAAVTYQTFRGSLEVGAAPPRSLAILPFRNLQPDTPNDFLGFSLADAIITRLGYVRSLTVRPSSAVEKYRNQPIDIPKVGTELKADTLLTGNFIREGDQIRITSQLISVKDQNILWKGAFDLKYDKLLTVQDSVAQQIVKELAVTLTPVEVQRLRAHAPADAMAYEYFLRGVDLYSRNEFAMAIRLLEKSAELDPKYALTWAHLGQSYQASASFQFGGEEQYRKAQAAYEKALALNPDQIEAHIFMANLLTDTGRVEQSVPLLREAYATNPNHPELLWELGYAYRFGGVLDESAKEAERARHLDPGVKLNNSAMNAYLYLGQYDRFLEQLPKTDDVAFVAFYRGLGEYYRKDFDAARRNFDRAYSIDPSLLQAQIGKAISDAISGDKASGLKLLKEVDRRVNQRGVIDAEATYKMAQAYAILGDAESALRMLGRSVENGFFPFSYMSSDPMLESLRGEAEYAKVMKMAEQRQQSFQKSFF